jgi:RNA polymerase sigma-70 factor (ECF subfamily)
MGGDTRFCVERLFREHGSKLEARLYRITRNHADAIELTQETYLRMIEIEDKDAIVNPRAYLFTVGTRLAFERVRQSRARDTLDIDDPMLEPELPQEVSAAEQIDQADFIARRDQALAELPARKRNAFWLQHEYGMSYEEIARHFGVSKETVKKDLSEVMRHLRQRLEPP